MVFSNNDYFSKTLGRIKVFARLLCWILSNKPGMTKVSRSHKDNVKMSDRNSKKNMEATRPKAKCAF